ncbi:MAG: hypothetical protein AAFO93_15615 [Pseudomonadota bacterium]
MTRRATLCALGLAVTLIAAPAMAEEDDDGTIARAEFFACMEAEAGRPCFDALEAAVPGWCPLMDNRIRTMNGDALFEAARALGSTAEPATSLDTACPDLASVSVPRGVSKSAICHQRQGWTALAAIKGIGS